MSLVTLSVLNSHKSAIERAGRVFPAREITTVEVSERRVREITACVHLRVVDHEAPEFDDGQTVDGQTVDATPVLAELPIAELRARADELGLSKGGGKVDIAARIEAHLAASAAEATDAGDGAAAIVGDGELADTQAQDTPADVDEDEDIFDLGLDDDEELKES